MIEKLIDDEFKAWRRPGDGAMDSKEFRTERLGYKINEIIEIINNLPPVPKSDTE